MITQELVKYIKEELVRGVSRKEIADALLAKGWTQEDAQEGFREALPPTKGFFPVLNLGSRLGKRLSLRILIPGIAIILVALGLVVYLFVIKRPAEFNTQDADILLKDPQALKELMIQPSDFNPENVITFPEGGAISSDIVSIKVASSVTREEANKFVSPVEARVIGEVPFDEFKYFHIKFQKPRSQAELKNSVSKLKSISEIKEVAPHLIFQSIGVFPPTDDISNLLPEDSYAFTKTRFPQAWERIRIWGQELRPAVVAVIDSSFDISHEELSPNLVFDYNGYQAHDLGNNDTDVRPDNPKDYHGTAVAGVVAAAINDRGINGAAPTAKVFPLKINGRVVFGILGEANMNIDLAVKYATAARVNVINISQTAKRSRESSNFIKDIFGVARFGAIEDAIKEAVNKGIIVVAGVGNDGKNADDYFPANMPEVIGVGGTDEEDQRWAGSNYSDNTAALWVAAPAKNIYVPVPKAVKASGYGHDDGTSYASPMVAGLAALLLQIGAAPSAIPDILRSTADVITVSYPDGSQHTWRRINAERAVNYVISPLPSPPLPSPSPALIPPPLPAAPPSPSPSNTIVSIDTAGNVGQFTSLAIGNDGLPVISYYDATNADLKLVKCGNSSCSSGNTIVTIDGYHGRGTDTGAWTSLAIGTDGNPIIAYLDRSFSNLKVVKCGNAACSSGNILTGVTPSGIDLASDSISIAVRSDGIPMISYNTSNGELRIVTCGNAACSSGNVTNGYSASGRYSALSIGADDRAIVSSFTSLYGVVMRVLKCATSDCSGYSAFYDVDSGPDSFGTTSIAVGSGSIATVSYYDATNGDLKVARCGNVNCDAGNVVTSVDTSGDVGLYSSLGLVSGDLPIISYYDVTEGDLKIVKCTTADCSSDNKIMRVDTLHDVGIYTSLAIGSDGLPIIAYYDTTNGDLKVLKCRTNTCE